MAARIADNSPEESSVYRIPSALTGERHRLSFATINRPPGHLLTKQDEKSEFLAVRFELQFAPNPSRDPDSDKELEDEVEAAVKLCHDLQAFRRSS